VAALVLGILGLLSFCFFVLSILAMIFGLIAASEIKQSNGRKQGLGMARAGWILGVVAILFGVAFWVASANGAFDDAVVTDELLSEQLAVGECINVDDIDDAEQVLLSAIPVIDCSDPHDGEVYFVGNINPNRSRDYPGDDDVAIEVEGLCTAKFAAYVGVIYDDSEFEIYYLMPLKPSWRSTHGEYTCVAYSTDGPVLTGTIRSSSR
jgi:hypothetical protein